jgi:hypothetical protein
MDETSYLCHGIRIRRPNIGSGEARRITKTRKTKTRKKEDNATIHTFEALAGRMPRLVLKHIVS